MCGYWQSPTRDYPMSWRQNRRRSSPDGASGADPKIVPRVPVAMAAVTVSVSGTFQGAVELNGREVVYIYISYHISYIFLGPNSFILPSDKMNLLGSPSCFDRFRTIDSIDVPYPRPPCARTLPGMPTPPWAQARTTQGAAAFEGWSSSQMALAVGGNIGRAVGIKILPVLHIYI